MSARKHMEASGFICDVANHQMEVLLDAGVYRHLRFRNPGTFNQWFEIVSWPCKLAISGDMGTYVFSRIEDMFGFFRRGATKDGLKINPQYWEEKLQAVDCAGSRGGASRHFSYELFASRVNEYVQEWIADNSPTPEEEAEPRDAVKDMVASVEDDEYSAHQKLRDFESGEFSFTDTWEWELRDYTFHFIWCLYAIVWGIAQYDALGHEGTPTSTDKENACTNSEAVT